MKRIIVLFLTAIMAISSAGCTTRHSIKHEFGNNYSYDRLFQAALLALNDKNFTITEDKKENGVITGRDYSSLYREWNFGFFLVLPFFYTSEVYPVVSIVLSKGENKILLSAGETTPASASSRIQDLAKKMEYFYAAHGKDSKFDAEEPAALQAVPAEIKPVEQATKTSFSRPNVFESIKNEGINGEIEWEKERGVNIANKDSFEWKEITVIVSYAALLGPSSYTANVISIKPGQMVNIKLTDFKDKDGKWIRSAETPDKIELKCSIGTGATGTAEKKF